MGDFSPAVILYNSTGTATLASSTSNPVGNEEALVVRPISNISNPTYVEFSDNRTLDAFGRLRVSTPFKLFESRHFYDKNALEWAEKIVNNSGNATITYIANNSLVELAVGSAIGDKVVRQSFRYFPYSPGNSFLALFTGVLEENGGQSGIVCRVGFFDDAADKTIDSGGDGFFFQLSGTTMSIGKRSYITGSQVDTVVNQSSWDIDKLDGDGPSGLTVTDFSKAYIWAMDFQWLGVGRVRIGLVLDGVFYPVHVFNHAGHISLPYSRTLSLPVRYEISNTTGVNTGKLKQICSAIVCEGSGSSLDEVYFFKDFTADTGIIPKTVGGAEIPVLSLRLKSNFNRALAFPNNIDVMISSNSDNVVLFRGYLDTVLTGASWVSVNTESVCEYDKTASAVNLANAHKIYSSYVKDKSTFHLDVRNSILYSNVTGTPAIFTLTAQSVGGDVSVFAATTISELK